MILNVETEIGENWINLIAAQLETETQDSNLFCAHDKYGNIIIKSFHIEDDIIVTYWQFRLHEAIEIHQQPSVDSKYYTLHIFHDTSIDNINNNMNRFLIKQGIHITPSESSIKLYLTEFITWEYMTITFSEKYFRSIITGTPGNNLLECKISMRLCETMSFHVNYVVDQLKSSYIENLSKFQIKTLCSYLLLTIVQDISPMNNSIYNKQKRVDPDVEKIMRIEAKLVEVNQLPNINFLARDSGMSLTKFRKLFKEIYGLPVYEYYAKNRIEKAKILLNDGFSVSEVATQLGYKKLHFFSKSFKSYTGLSPSVFQRNVKN